MNVGHLKWFYEDLIIIRAHKLPHTSQLWEYLNDTVNINNPKTLHKAKKNISNVTDNIPEALQLQSVHFS